MRQSLHLYKFMLVCSSFCISVEAGWLDRKAEGWAWYEDLQKEKKEKHEKKEVLTASEQISQARKELEELLAEAMLRPSVENIQLYMETQKLWMERSAEFANAWQKIIIGNPQLDPTATSFATSQFGRQLQKAMEQEEKEQLIKTIASEYGLFYFYEGKSKLSKAFALVINAFAKKYGWSVLGISADGEKLSEIPNTLIDNGIIQEMDIQVFPALFAINPKFREAIPLSFGLRTIDQIEENIIAQFKQTEEES